MIHVLRLWNISEQNKSFGHNTPNQQSKFRTKKGIEVNDDTRGRYNTNSQIKFKTSMLKSSLCDYSNAYILFRGTIIILGAMEALRRTDRNNKQAIFKVS